MVEGAVYHVKMVEHGERLAAYETNNYKTHPCRISYTDGKEPRRFRIYLHVQGGSEGFERGNFLPESLVEKNGKTCCGGKA